jgi:hypothetical protein
MNRKAVQIQRGIDQDHFFDFDKCTGLTTTNSISTKSGIKFLAVQHSLSRIDLMITKR